MKREIKFRAYHIGEEKMCTVSLLRSVGAFLDQVVPEPDQIVSDKWYIAALETGRFCDMAEFHLMQYTGLKDKNGKEIYEGDIIESNGSSYKIVFGFEEDSCVICWHAELINNENVTWPLGFSDYDSHKNKYIQVIGNIYENPELF